MNYGMQISAAGAQAAMFRQDSIANNLANLNTVGFKPTMASAMHRQHVRAEDNLWNLPSDELLEQLGGGVLSGRVSINFQQGPLQASGNDLDVAIQGEGFFTIGDGANPSLTRDGRFTLDPEGRLIGTTSALPVLDADGDQIFIDRQAGPVSIASDGLISQNDVQVATLGLFDVSDRSALIKAGNGLFAHASGQPLNLTESTGLVRQNMVEGSAVDEIGT
ncbi:MAG: flagellar hook basal-body protein, partial [Planctomycetota bacterium]